MIKWDNKDISRFWSKVGPADVWGCRLWQGAVSSKGYGKFWVKGEVVSAHRFYQQAVLGARIPQGYVCSHICRRFGASANHKLCVVHTEIVSQRKNLQEDCLGEEHWKAAVRDRDVRLVLELYRMGGLSQADIARILTSKGYRCNQASVSRWINRVGRTANKRYDSYFS